MPYRIDVPDAGDQLLDRLVELGALDVEPTCGNGIAALMPDSVTLKQIASTLGIHDISVSPALGRDNSSVWVLSLRPIRIGSLRIVPAELDAEPGDLRLLDAGAFGTGLHSTTAICLEALHEIVQRSSPTAVLDVGTGSGVLALAALILGVPRALAIDVDDAAIRAAADNARLNGLSHRLHLERGGPETVAGAWPLVLANILAAPLIEMAPTLIRRLGHGGQLVLSGIPRSLEPDVSRAYVRLGMQRVDVKPRGDWIGLVLRASW